MIKCAKWLVYANTVIFLYDIRSVSVMVTVAKDCPRRARDMVVEVSCTWKVSSGSGIVSSTTKMLVHTVLSSAVNVNSPDVKMKPTSLVAASIQI